MTINKLNIFNNLFKNKEAINELSNHNKQENSKISGDSKKVNISNDLEDIK